MSTLPGTSPSGAALDTADFGRPVLVTLGMFIIDEFSYMTEDGQPDTTRQVPEPQIGGGGTYAIIGARVWLPPSSLAMIVDKGPDFPEHIYKSLCTYASTSPNAQQEDLKSLFYFRPQETGTTRALNAYRGEHRDFEYLTPRIRIEPEDHVKVGSVAKSSRPKTMHFVCSPRRAKVIIENAKQVGWLGSGSSSTTERSLGSGRRDTILIFEPIPFRCVPEELPALIDVLPEIDVLSPNAEEALSLLSIPIPKSPPEMIKAVEQAAARFLSFNMHPSSVVVIRSGELGAFVLTPTSDTDTKSSTQGRWIPPYHTTSTHVVDVTGAGNSFLGGFAAGLHRSDGDVYEAALYGSVSASFVIEQVGLPALEAEMGGEVGPERWNGISPGKRLEQLRARVKTAINSASDP